MAVFTEVTPAEAGELLSTLGLGALQSLQGISSGIENTNYFVSTDRGEHVLTLFERLSAEQLPFYLNLMQHLAARGIPVPAPQANAQGEILHHRPLPAARLGAFVHRARAADAADAAGELHRQAAGDAARR